MVHSAVQSSTKNYEFTASVGKLHWSELCRCLMFPWLVISMMELIALGCPAVIGFSLLGTYLLLQVCTTHFRSGTLFHSANRTGTNLSLVQGMFLPALLAFSTPTLLVLAAMAVWLTVLAAYWALHRDKVGLNMHFKFFTEPEQILQSQSRERVSYGAVGDELRGEPELPGTVAELQRVPPLAEPAVLQPPPPPHQAHRTQHRQPLPHPPPRIVAHTGLGTGSATNSVNNSQLSYAKVTQIFPQRNWNG